MAEYSNLSATINAQIRANGVQAITGPVLNAVLTAMVNVLGDGYRLAGVAHPADNPGSPDNRVAYLAAEDGTYTNFGGLAVSGEVALLLWDSAWTKATLFSIDTAVTPGSGHLVTSGAVDDALTTLANNIAAAYMQLVPAATEGNLAEFDNAGQVRDAGLATSDLATKDGHHPDLFAGFAGNLVDTRSAGTRQGPFAFRQSGGDGVNYMRKILGRTEAFNQLVGDNDTEVTVTSGHKYFAIIGGVASVATSDGSPISVTGGVDIVVDLTLEGLGLTTADQFRALHPLGYYSPASKLINNAATGLETTGFNQWDEVAEGGGLTNGQPTAGPNSYRFVNYVEIEGGSVYYLLRGDMDGTAYACYYDANKIFISDAVVSASTFTPPAGSRYLKMFFYKSSSDWGSNVPTFKICINRSDASRNGIYEPYWKREIVLGLNNLACHDENNNAVVVNGLDGVGTAQDELVVENGWGTKIIKKRTRINLGDITWNYDSVNAVFYSTTQSAYAKANNSICERYATTSGRVTQMVDKSFLTYDGNYSNEARFYVKDTAFTDAATFKTAMSGVYADVELATPKVLTLDNPIPALIEVDNLGTEKRLPEDTADNPQAPFECDSNYSVSTANLVRLLNL